MHFSVKHNWKSLCKSSLLFKRQEILSEKVYLESQCDYGAGRFTTDMTLSFAAATGEQSTKTTTPFIDLTKAFDLVSRCNSPY